MVVGGGMSAGEKNENWGFGEKMRKKGKGEEEKGENGLITAWKRIFKC